MTTSGPGKVLGLDISSKFVGWAVFEDLEPRQHGLYRQQGKDHGEKLHTYLNWLLGIFKEFKPDNVVIELPFAGRRRKTFGILTLYTAVTMLAHWRYFSRELPEDNKLQAREIKHLMQVTKGEDHDENKQIMTDAINRLFGLNLRFDATDTSKRYSEDDIADSYAVVLSWLIKFHYMDPFERNENRTPKKSKPTKARHTPRTRKRR